MLISGKSLAPLGLGALLEFLAEQASEGAYPVASGTAQQCIKSGPELLLQSEPSDDTQQN
jgi:hypothetical protein